MPIYEYECGSCGHRLEAIQKISDEPLKECPSCHKPELKKLISAAAFRLKGGGWYETDFKSGKKKNVVESGKSESGAKKDSKSDAKSSDSGKGSGTASNKKASTKSASSGEK
ncbi:MAG: zinc ribbon domain-containing protein [Gammaproteobacteria bacterium]|jgi:putative FmdB family regulatory protein|nr:zinc ribbon domain-containing protein [Gammaproteobacteria bacterium]